MQRWISLCEIQRCINENNNILWKCEHSKCRDADQAFIMECKGLDEIM